MTIAVVNIVEMDQAIVKGVQVDIEILEHGTITVDNAINTNAKYVTIMLIYVKYAINATI